MQKIIITNKGLDFQKVMKEEERESQFVKNIQKEKVQAIKQRSDEGNENHQRALSSQYSTSEKLFYANTGVHFYQRRQEFSRKEKKNLLRGVYQNFLVKRDDDYSEQKWGQVMKKGEDSNGNEQVLAKSTKTLDSGQTNTSQFIHSLNKFIPPQLCPANKIASDMRINHLTQTQLNFNLTPVILNNQGTSNVTDRMEKKRLQYINETISTFSRLKLNNQIEKEQANQNTVIPKTEELFKDNIQQLDTIIKSSDYEKQRYKERIKTYHIKNFHNQRLKQQQQIDKQNQLKNEHYNQEQTLSLEFKKQP